VEQLDRIAEKTKIPRSVLIREGVQEIIKKYNERSNFNKGESDL
jgi:predicted transcriptional regulator